LLHNHPHLSSGACTIGQKWPQYLADFVPPHLKKTSLEVPRFWVFPHLMFNFNDPKSIISVFNYLHLRLSCLAFETAAPENEFKWGFHCIYFTAPIRCTQNIRYRMAFIINPLSHTLSQYLGTKNVEARFIDNLYQ
jgi:hypothetical protein